MQSNEMPSIEREHDPLFCHGKREDIRIRDRLPGPATLRSRQDVMTEAPQDLHDWQGKIFVGIAPRHSSRRFVGKNVVLYLLLVRTGIGPGMGQIQPATSDSSARGRLHECRDVSLGLRPRREYACGRYRARPRRHLGYSPCRETRPQGRGRPTQDLRFFCTGQGGEKVFNFVQCLHNFVSVPRLQVVLWNQYTTSSALWWG